MNEKTLVQLLGSTKGPCEVISKQVHRAVRSSPASCSSVAETAECRKQKWVLRHDGMRRQKKLRLQSMVKFNLVVH